MSDKPTIKQPKALFSAIGNGVKALSTALQSPPETLLSWCGHCLALVSAFSSSAGIYAFASISMGDGVVARLIALVLAGIGGLVVQAVVVASIKLIAREGRLNAPRTYLALATALLAWTLSVTTSFGLWWNATARDSYEGRATQQAIDSASEPLNGAATRFSNATASFALVAAHSADMAAIEAAEGSSCGNAAPGQGPRFALRTRQEAAATRLSAALEAENNALEEAINGLGASSSNSELAQAHRAARSAISSPSVVEARSFVQNELIGFSTGFQDGEFRFACTDERMTNLLQAADEALSELPALEQNPPRIVQVSDTEGVLLSAARLWKFLLGIEQDDLVTEADLIPAAIPVVIELALTALLLLGEGRDKGPSGGGSGRSRSILKRPRPGGPDPILAGLSKPSTTQSQGFVLIDAWQDHVIESDAHQHAILVVPKTPGARRELARRLLAVCIGIEKGPFGSMRISRIQGKHKFDDLPKVAIEGWDWSDTMCELYPIPFQVAARVGRELSQHAFSTTLDDAWTRGKSDRESAFEERLKAND